MRLALVMIVRDEARGIARALTSVREHVDQMIVLDTGSSDGTPDIARSLGAVVGHFAWCDDFAAARNAALDLSEADWNLILDGDEWLEGDVSALSPESLPPLAGGEDGFVGYVRQVNQTRLGEDIERSQAWVPRILPRGVRYEGTIHEQPVSALPSRPTTLEIQHDGYLGEQLDRKAGRNEAMLIAELERTPEDPYLWFQLGKEYQVREAPPQAAHCFAEALRLTPAGAPWRHSLVVRALTAFKTAERFGEAVALADQEFEAWQESPDFFFALGDLYLEGATRNPDAALSDFLPMVEFAWKRCLEIGERPELDGAVRGRGGHLAAHNLAVFYGTLGQTGKAAEYAALAARLKARP